MLYSESSKADWTNQFYGEYAVRLRIDSEYRRYWRNQELFSGTMFFAPVRVIAADIKVIANGSVKADAISASEVKSVFLEEYNSLRDGTHVEPVLEKDWPVHQAFLHEYLGGTDDDLQNYYRALVFSGRGSMPKQLGSDAEVVAYVAKTKGAIGYVSAETIGEDVKTLTVRGGNGAQRRLLTQVEPAYPDTLKRLNIGGTVRLRLTDHRPMVSWSARFHNVRRWSVG